MTAAVVSFATEGQMIDSKSILKQLHSARVLAAKELARLEATIKAFGGSVETARLKVGKRTLSKRAKKAIGDAQRKRWAAFKAKKSAKKTKRLPAAPNA
jgi:hypothetical protein